MLDFLPVINSFGDLLRLGIFIVCCVCLVLLVLRFIHRHDNWNAKTRDYWFALVMWSLAGATIGVQGLYEELDITPRTVMVTAAALVSLMGLSRRGGWGDDE